MKFVWNVNIFCTIHMSVTESPSRIKSYNSTTTTTITTNNPKQNSSNPLRTLNVQPWTFDHIRSSRHEFPTVEKVLNPIRKQLVTSSCCARITPVGISCLAGWQYSSQSAAE